MSVINSRSNKINMIKGDSRRFTVEITDEDDQVFDITGFAITMSVRKDKRDPSYIFQKKNDLAGGDATQIDVFDSTNGKFYLYLKKNDTIVLLFQGDDYVYDIKLVDGDNNKTPILSTIKLVDGVNQT